ncbi:MAG: SRPBCC family protein [Acidimicrobiia bacterium]|nr:SRPBCC family protein [Acidimicrobiia bacterium]
MSTLSVRTPSDTQVEVSRSFASSVALVWRALTEPALVNRWLLGPPGWSMPVCESDFRVGGRYEYGWRSEADGGEFGFVGEFREIEPQSKIVHTEGLREGSPGAEVAGGSLVTITFEEMGGVTTVVTTIEYPSKEARDAVLAQGMTDGMEMSYRHLDELLARL